MATIMIPSKLWHRLADVIQDMGNHHPQFRGSEAGADLEALGTAIKYGVPAYEGAPLDLKQQEYLAHAEAIVRKHGGWRADLSPVERCIETAEKLLGLWANCDSDSLCIACQNLTQTARDLGLVVTPSELAN